MGPVVVTRPHGAGYLRHRGARVSRSPTRTHGEWEPPRRDGAAARARRAKCKGVPSAEACQEQSVPRGAASELTRRQRCSMHEPQCAGTGTFSCDGHVPSANACQVPGRSCSSKASKNMRSALAGARAGRASRGDVLERGGWRLDWSEWRHRRR